MYALTEYDEQITYGVFRDGVLAKIVGHNRAAAENAAIALRNMDAYSDWAVQPIGIQIH